MILSSMDKRLLTKEEAAAYCGAGPRQFSRWVKQGILPQRVLGIYRWDIRAIDAALNEISGLASQGELTPAVADWATKKFGAEIALAEQTTAWVKERAERRAEFYPQRSAPKWEQRWEAQRAEKRERLKAKRAKRATSTTIRNATTT
jgi:hypothetical protein